MGTRKSAKIEDNNVVCPVLVRKNVARPIIRKLAQFLSSKLNSEPSLDNFRTRSFTQPTKVPNDKNSPAVKSPNAILTISPPELSKSQFLRITQPKTEKIEKPKKTKKTEKIEKIEKIE